MINLFPFNTCKNFVIQHVLTKFDFFGMQQFWIIREFVDFWICIASTCIVKEITPNRMFYPLADMTVALSFFFCLGVNSLNKLVHFTYSSQTIRVFGNYTEFSVFDILLINGIARCNYQLFIELILNIVTIRFLAFFFALYDNSMKHYHFLFVLPKAYKW
jgi:hypothetical protein